MSGEWLAAKHKILISILIITSCKNETLIYSIQKEYRGVCAVFVIQNENKNIMRIEFQKGLSIMSKADLSKNFIFEDNDKKNQISIIEIGKKAIDMDRHIFQLTNNRISKCTTTDIEVITFFVGTQKEFEHWENKRIDELTTFETLGVDWCSFYKKHLFPA